MEHLSASNTQSWLSWFYRGLLILAFLILIARLFDLQVIKGAYYKELADNNRVRKVPITAARGKILARGGETLVDNRLVTKHVVFDPLEGYEKLLDITDAPEDELIQEFARVYSMGTALAHTSGYLGETNQEELGKVDPKCLQKGTKSLGSLVGRTGLEQQYDCVLRGIDGEELVEVDSLGQKVRVLGRREPIQGSDIRTTIHLGLQQKVADIVSESDLVEGSAAVIVTDTGGEVLTLYSHPSFDPNSFVKANDVDIKNIFSDESLPLFNRATSGAFAPGSVFKPIVTVSALETDAIEPDYKYTDTGNITLNTAYGTFSYSNWYLTQYGQTEGEIGISRAIARSTDTFFYKLGELTGIDEMVKWSDKFGIGKPTGIDIPGEISGLLPSPDWKEETKDERWFLGNTYHFAIGQSDLALTPIQINQATSAIATGKLCKPHIVGDKDCIDLDISDSTLNIIKTGMRQACSSGGTGYTFFKSPIPVACKTGTAETGKGDSTHAWFTFFAPYGSPESDEDLTEAAPDSENNIPEIVVTVLVEEGGEGSKVAGPIAREIYDYYFKLGESKP